MNMIEQALVDAMADYNGGEGRDTTVCKNCGEEFDSRQERREHEFDADKCPEVSELIY